MVGVTGSIPVAPTTQFIGIELGATLVRFARKMRAFLYPILSLRASQDTKFTPNAVLSLPRKIPFLTEGAKTDSLTEWGQPV